MRTLLVSMPFGALDRPALGISLLKAALQRDGHHCDVAYAFEPFVGMIGSDTYTWLAEDVPYTAFPGDWCFTLPLYGRRPEADWAYVDRILRHEWRLSAAEIERIVKVRERTPAYLAALMNGYDWASYDIVGFTSTFVQNIASLACAKALKARFPHLRIVFGGANWESDMGAALFETFRFVDHVCQGEADESFPALVQALADGAKAPRIPGVLSRDATPVAAVPVSGMDRLPFPDFGEFFEMRSRTCPEMPATLLMETSRGCWWGAKHHCTFCGLNGEGMGFRVKAPARALAEFDHVLGHYQADALSMVDNILDMSYFETVLPKLAERSDVPPIFYETKANLSRDQVAMLSRSGIRTIQPGIESLSDRVLGLMRKGTTGLRNIQLLRCAREHNVGVEWNVLYGFPGETDADYDEMLTMLPKIVHLQPPSGIGPVRIDRFSPYYETPEAFGISGLRPLPVFEHLYPVSEARRARIACYFEADHGASLASETTVAALASAVEDWRGARGMGLSAHDDGRSLKIRDTRHGRDVTHELAGAGRLTGLACDRVASRTSVAAILERHGEDATDDWLDRLVEAELVIESGGRYLSLYVFDRFPSDWNQIQAAHAMEAT